MYIYLTCPNSQLPVQDSNVRDRSERKEVLEAYQQPPLEGRVGPVGVVPAPSMREHFLGLAEVEDPVHVDGGAAEGEQHAQKRPSTDDAQHGELLGARAEGGEDGRRDAEQHLRRRRGRLDVLGYVLQEALHHGLYQNAHSTTSPEPVDLEVLRPPRQVVGVLLAAVVPKDILVLVAVLRVEVVELRGDRRRRRGGHE